MECIKPRHGMWTDDLLMAPFSVLRNGIMSCCQVLSRCMGTLSPPRAPHAEFFHLVVSGGHVMKWNLSSKNDWAFQKMKSSLCRAFCFLKCNNCFVFWNSLPLFFFFLFLKITGELKNKINFCRCFTQRDGWPWTGEFPIISISSFGKSLLQGHYTRHNGESHK